MLEYIPNADALLGISQVSLSADGKTALVGVSNVTVGASVLEYNTLSNSWERTALLQTDSSHISYSIALSSDGNTAVIGTPRLDDYGGAAWVFTREVTSGPWNQNAQVLTGNDASGVPYQGFSVSISGMGTLYLEDRMIVEELEQPGFFARRLQLRSRIPLTLPHQSRILIIDRNIQKHIIIDLLRQFPQLHTEKLKLLPRKE